MRQITARKISWITRSPRPLHMVAKQQWRCPGSNARQAARLSSPSTSHRPRPEHAPPASKRMLNASSRHREVSPMPGRRRRREGHCPFQSPPPPAEDPPASSQPTVRMVSRHHGTRRAQQPGQCHVTGNSQYWQAVSRNTSKGRQAVLQWLPRRLYVQWQEAPSTAA